MKHLVQRFFFLLSVLLVCIFTLPACSSFSDHSTEIKVTYCNQLEETSNYSFWDFYETDKNKATYRSEITYNKDGVPLYGELRDQNTNALVCVLTYDSDGHLKKLVNRSQVQTGLVRIAEFEYNKDNKLSKVSTSLDEKVAIPDEGKDYRTQFTYEYNAAGNILQISWLDANGEFTPLIKYDYDANQKITKESITTWDTTRTTTYFYNSQNQIEKTTVYETSIYGDPYTDDTLYEYQENMLVKMTTFEANSQRVTAEKEFDKAGNLIKSVRYSYFLSPDDPNALLEEPFLDDYREYQFDARGNQIRLVQKGALYHIEETREYDENDRIIQHTLINQHIPYASVQYTYNQEGLCIKSIVQNASGYLLEEHDGYAELDVAMLSSTTIAYDINLYNQTGDLIIKHRRNSDDMRLQYTEYQHYETGKIKSITRYNPDGSIQEHREYEKTKIYLE